MSAELRLKGRSVVSLKKKFAYSQFVCMLYFCISELLFEYSNFMFSASKFCYRLEFSSLMLY